MVLHGGILEFMTLSNTYQGVLKTDTVHTFAAVR